MAIQKASKKEIQEKIQAEIEKTEGRIADLKEMCKPVPPDDAIGRISRIDAINNKSITESSLRKAEEKLRGLHLMLSRVGKPDFGLCSKCKKPVSLVRLLLVPQSRFCVNCA